MECPRILLVDDEPDIAAFLQPTLERAGFRVLTAANGAEALRKVTTFQPDLIVLDVLMPGTDGRQVLRQLRQQGDRPPVIMLTQVDGASERTMTLEEGADDYVNKPCDPHELVARIRAVLRRSRPGPASLAAARKLRCGNLVLDRQRRQAYLGRKALLLEPKAFGVLEYLMQHANELCRRDSLLDEVWGWDYPCGPRTVDVRIAELRRQLQDDAGRPRYIETVTGQGYRFLGDVEVLS